MISLVSTSNNFYEEELNTLSSNPVVQYLSIEVDDYLTKSKYQIPNNSLCKTNEGTLVIAVKEVEGNEYYSTLIKCYNLLTNSYLLKTKYQLIPISRHQITTELKEIIKYSNKVIKELTETNLVLEAIQYKIK